MNVVIRKINHAADYLMHDRAQLMNSLLSSFFTWLPDKQFIQLKFRFSLGYWPDLKHPQTFNEKLNWLKLYNRRPEYTQMVDKYAAKDYVAKIIGKEYVIPTLGVWEKPEDIEWENLPSQFVLKTTHGGGNSGVVICKDKDTFDKELAISRLKESLQQDLYKDSKEWPYKDVPRKIIAEKYIEDEILGELADYKFFCFHGKVKALFVATERQKREEPFFNFFDEDYNSLDFKQGHPRASVPPAKPELFDQMKVIAEKLSQNIPQVRVDLYQVNGKLYFGEMTFYHFGGMVPFEPKEWDYKFGSWLMLPNKS